MIELESCLYTQNQVHWIRRLPPYIERGMHLICWLHSWLVKSTMILTKGHSSFSHGYSFKYPLTITQQPGYSYNIKLIPSKLNLSSNLSKYTLSITSLLVAQSFWNFAQSTAVSLPCCANFQNDWATEKIVTGKWDLSWEMSFGAISYIVATPRGLVDHSAARPVETVYSIGYAHILYLQWLYHPFVAGFIGIIYPYSSVLLHWHWGSWASCPGASEVTLEYMYQQVILTRRVYSKTNNVIRYQNLRKAQQNLTCVHTLIVRFMGPTLRPSGANRAQVDPMLAPWTLLSE